MKKEEQKVVPCDRTTSSIVGIGASAGGLEALEAFFDNVPLRSGMAFVVVQHLSPDFRSLMDELLARHTVDPRFHPTRPELRLAPPAGRRPRGTR